MKKISLFSLITFLTLSITLLSCGGGGGGGTTPTPPEDKTPPVVDLTNLKPTNGQVITLDGTQGTGTLDFSANLKDNEGLASYSIDIHINYPTHTHPGATTRSVQDKEPFVAKKTGTLNGQKEASIKESFPIAPIQSGGKYHMIQDGEYHLVLTVIDKAGNKLEVLRVFTIAYPKG